MKLTKSFTLIEVLVAMGIFMIGITPILALLGSSARLHQDNMKHVQTVDFVTERFGYYRAQHEVNNSWASSYGWANEWGQSSRYPDLFYAAEMDPIGAKGFLITLGVGTSNPAGSGNTDSRYKDFHQFTLLLVNKK